MCEQKQWDAVVNVLNVTNAAGDSASEAVAYGRIMGHVLFTRIKKYLSCVLGSIGAAFLGKCTAGQVLVIAPRGGHMSDKPLAWLQVLRSWMILSTK